MKPNRIFDQSLSNLNPIILSEKNVYRVLISLGIILRLGQYIYNRSFYIDEAALALGLIDLNNSVFKPLPINQVAPVLFLLTERAFIYLFGNNEYALRAFPFLCSILSLPFFKKVVFQITRNSNLSTISLFLFVFSPILIFYSSSLKQYSSDLLVFLVLVSVVLEEMEFKQKMFMLSILGILSIFLSNIGVLVLFCCYIFLLFNQILKRKLSVYFLFSSISLLLAFGINYFLFIKDHPTRSFMIASWENAFMPLNPLKYHYWQWLIETFSLFFKKIFWGQAAPNIFILGLVVLVFVLFIAGIIRELSRKNYSTLFWTLFPIILHLLLSSFRLYPFHNRLILYLVPFTIVIIANGLQWIVYSIRIKLNYKLHLIFSVILILGYLIPLANNYPIEKEEIKKALKIVEKEIYPGDNLIVSSDTKIQFDYYLESGEYTFNSIPITYSLSMDEMKKEIYKISSPNTWTWVVFSHKMNENQKEINSLINGLVENGKVKNLHRFTGSMVFAFSINMDSGF